MKNFKKIALGLMVGAMAIGFSAFTNAKTSFGHKTLYNASYYSLDGTASHSASDYVYDENGSCTSSTKICSAVWQTTIAPVQGDAPAGSPMFENGTEPGTYKP
ncbi:hypothetical protein [Mucilaginibacter sp. L196]|uniref:hypothetical protein n=1 Tax=Mucilaginibacter sp. L196 TaxID=1641870 RepID=UPI00131DD4D2|nr:hypothetical protein [Mucilaginibacter sp. L196]